jgi:hypothetical protein
VRRDGVCRMSRFWRNPLLADSSLIGGLPLCLRGPLSLGQPGGTDAASQNLSFHSRGAPQCRAGDGRMLSRPIHNKRRLLQRSGPACRRRHSQCDADAGNESRSGCQRGRAYGVADDAGRRWLHGRPRGRQRCSSRGSDRLELRIRVARRRNSCRCRDEDHGHSRGTASSTATTRACCPLASGRRNRTMQRRHVLLLGASVRYLLASWWRRRVVLIRSCSNNDGQLY